MENDKLQVTGSGRAEQRLREIMAEKGKTQPTEELSPRDDMLQEPHKERRLNKMVNYLAKQHEQQTAVPLSPTVDPGEKALHGLFAEHVDANPGIVQELLQREDGRRALKYLQQCYPQAQEPAGPTAEEVEAKQVAIKARDQALTDLHTDRDGQAKFMDWMIKAQPWSKTGP